MTECTGNYGSANAAANLVWEVHNVLLGPIRYGARASLYWNLALGTNGEPHRGGCSNCRGMIAINPATGAWRPSQDYYYWEQFSRFIQPGAVRIGSTNPGLGSIETVAFQNPDGTIVLVALNTDYTGNIVQWDGDSKAQKTAWLVGPDGRRRWISNIATYNCLKANGAAGPDVLGSWQLDHIVPDSKNVWAVCGADRIGVNSMLQQGFYARSLNGQYTLRLTGSNLALTDSAGHVIWSTGAGGADLILQADGNLVEYSGGRPVWASNTVGSGAAWLVVNNDGTLELYDGPGHQVWTSVNPGAYIGHIVEWVNGGGKPNTSWIVSSDGKRYWIPDTSTYWCMVNIGFSDLGPQPPGVLNALPDSGQWAHCPISPPGAQDTLSAGQGLYQGQSITSLNGQYRLILQQDHNLVLYGSGGALWATNRWTGGYVVMQGDGNFVGYSQWDSPTWATGTAGDGGNCDLVVQNDSNLVLYCGGVAKWDRFHGRL
jgi:hypothetical protein